MWWVKLSEELPPIGVEVVLCLPRSGGNGRPFTVFASRSDYPADTPRLNYCSSARDVSEILILNPQACWIQLPPLPGNEQLIIL